MAKKLVDSLITIIFALLILLIVFGTYNAVWSTGYKSGLRHATEMSQENK